MIKLLKTLVLYFQFFTAIPINLEIDQATKGLAEGVVYLPLFALAYGWMLASFYTLLRIVVDIEQAWLLLLMIDVLLTNGLHHDGLADSADGLFSGKKPEIMLAIMKDSRIGTHGIIALIFFFLIQYSFGSSLLNYRSGLHQEAILIILWTLVGRGGLMVTFYKLYYKSHNPKGLGSFFEKIPDIQLYFGQGLVLLFSFFLLPLTALTYGLVLILICGYRQFIYQKVGGFSGDTMGASVLISQTLFLILMQILVNILGF